MFRYVRFAFLVGVLSVSGCGSTSLYRLADELPEGAPKGYVEFYYAESNGETTDPTIVPTVGAISVHQRVGEKTRYWGSITGELFSAPSLREQVVWRLRIAMPPGEQSFTITLQAGGSVYEIVTDPSSGRVRTIIGSFQDTRLKPIEVRVRVKEGMIDFVRVNARAECETAFRNVSGPRKCLFLGDVRQATTISASKDANASSLLARALREGDWTVRWHAARESAGNRSAEVVHGLLAALKDVAPWVRIEAAHSLVTMNDPNVRQPVVLAMIEEMKRTKDPITRAAAADLLGELGDRKALEPLRQFLNDIETERKRLSERKDHVITSDHAMAAGRARVAIRRIEGGSSR